MPTAIAKVPTDHGTRYVRQLCKHWAHKFEVEQVSGKATIRVANALITLESSAERLTVAITAADIAAVKRLKPVLAAHLDRFAFREAPLLFEWSAAG